MGEEAITAEMNLEALKSFVASTPETIAWKTLEARWHSLDLPFMEIISCCGESAAITSDTDRFKTFRDLCERAHSAASNITSAEFPEDCTEDVRREVVTLLAHSKVGPPEKPLFGFTPDIATVIC